MDNAQIADRLDAFAALLELAETSAYAARAYRGAAETIRGTALSVAELVEAGKAREPPADLGRTPASQAAPASAAVSSRYFAGQTSA